MIGGMRARKRALAAACAAAAMFGGGERAMASCPETAPTQTIKIFNDSDQFLFPELEVGLSAQDIWMQAECEVPNSKIGDLTYGQDKTFRFYIRPNGGIPPNASVSITLPLFTQLVKTVDASKPNQYAEWWQGQNIQIFTSSTSTPPMAFSDALNNISRTHQEPLKSELSNPVWPACLYTAPQPQPASPAPAPVSCALELRQDTDGTLPKNGPSQLFEATLGARQAQEVVNDGPPNKLDKNNADFDVSYVNVAYMAGAMGPYQNDQTGYVGSPMKPMDFRAKLIAFQKAYDWPQFQSTDANAPSSQKVVDKLPSPLELIARLSGANAPADLPPVDHWPDQVWKPIEKLRTEWTTWSQQCRHSMTRDGFCDAILDVKDLIDANYRSYVELFKAEKCTGTMVPETADRFLAHVYGWTPWTESIEATDKKKGCTATDNLLENTSTFYKNNDYAEYSRVKLEFDNLNYGTFPAAKYVFNPWVEFIHNNTKYLNIKNAYAYSVDDAVGNLQAEGKGFIIDIGDTKHLENSELAQPPINVAIGWNKGADLNFASYRLCENVPSRDKTVDPNNSQFILSASNPARCPVFLIDNKQPPQTYTFTLTAPPPFTQFTLAQKAAGLPKWSNQTPYDTAKVVDCSGNTTTAPFKQSSKAWCCSLTNKRGVFAYSVPDPHSVHQLLMNYVNLLSPLPYDTTNEISCSEGQ